MSQYTKLKNTELEALLKERGLPTGGKKADMVARLTKDDEESKTAANAAPSKIDAEDEIDWDDEGEEGTTEAAKPAAAAETKPEASAPTATTESNDAAKAGGVGEVGNPQEVPNQKADVDPATTDDLSVKPPNNEKNSETTTATEKVDYTMGLAATNIEDEIAKRKRRAEKFGLKVDDNESLKLLERAKKFGGGAPRGLDDALPERPERRKRGRDDNDDGGRNKRRGGGGRFGGRGGRGNRDGDRRRDNQGGDRANTGGGGTSWMSEADRQKAEARKAKFAKSGEMS